MRKTPFIVNDYSVSATFSCEAASSLVSILQTPSNFAPSSTTRRWICNSPLTSHESFNVNVSLTKILPVSLPQKSRFSQTISPSISAFSPTTTRPAETMRPSNRPSILRSFGELISPFITVQAEILLTSFTLTTGA